ncbi:MAG: Smr/MutS family protein [Gammaproteobacteria bacterium]
MAKKKITEDDKELFRKSIGKVRPMKTDKPFVNLGKNPPPYPREKTVDYAEKIDTSFDAVRDVLYPGDLLSFHVPGIQKSVLKKLRKGFFGVDAELDLHGLTGLEAENRLLKFLHDCAVNGDHCVHIIHGKGFRSPDNRPVLKNLIDEQLRRHRDVLAFCSCPPRDGGAGAVYVLLRRSDKYGEQEKPE